MHSMFLELIDSLDPKFQSLLRMSPVRYAEIPRGIPKRAIYLFSEDNTHLYVGRTNNLRSRLRGHCIPSATHFTATFAFRIAREKTGFTRATYTSEGSRKHLCSDPIFGPAFEEAKRRAANMSIRFVEESEPVKQALLEIYVATVLGTKYNDFDNH